MRLLRRGLRVVAVALVAVASGVAINQVLNGGKWNLGWLAAAIVLAAIVAGLDLWLGTHDSNHGFGNAARPVLWPDLADDAGMPVPLSKVTPRELGVHPSRFGADGDSPYISRAADHQLAGALTNGEKRLIIVEGARLAGTTSTLAQAAQTCLPDHLAAGFTDDPRVSLKDMITQAGRWAADAQARAAGAVVWLDGLTPDRFAELARVPLDELPPGVWVLATLDTDELEGLRIPEQLSILLDRHAVRVRLGAITDHERRDLLTEDAYAALRPVLEEKEDLFLGRLMVAWEPLRAALTRGSSEQATDRVALLRAATDWYRVHLPRILSPKVLGHLYRAYRRELTGGDPDSPISAAGFTDALRWATAARAADRPRLIDLQDVPRGQRYAPHPLLAAIADDPSEDVGWRVSDVLWSYADHHFRGDQRRDIGYSALSRGEFHAAARLLSHADTIVDPEAYGQIAKLFYEHTEWASSRHWWQKAISSGRPDYAPKAMFNLGVLEMGQGDFGRARHWWQQAASSGHPDYARGAMAGLGALELEQGNAEEARRWWQQAASSGHAYHAPMAMANLGVLEHEQGNAEQARHWLQQAASSDHPDHAPKAMGDLGGLEYEQGNAEEARHWWRQAVSSDHPDHAPKAMAHLGGLEYEQGNAEQARHWWQQAVNSGHPDYAPMAMAHLGGLEHEQGNAEQARHWWQQAVSSGHPDHAPKAMGDLGGLEHEQGNAEQARHWWQQAASSGHPDHASRAMANLGTFEHEQGNAEQARHWLQQAASSGHPDHAPRAMVNLGGLESQRGNAEQGRRWLLQAVSVDHPDYSPVAMVNLGYLESRQGNAEQGRRWFQQAANSDHPAATSRAQQELRALDRHKRDRQRGERFGQYGYLAHADPDLMKRDDHSPETPTSTAADHAHEFDGDVSDANDAD